MHQDKVKKCVWFRLPEIAVPAKILQSHYVNARQFLMNQ